MILISFYCFSSQYMTSDSDYEVKKIIIGLKTLQMFSKTINYDRGTIWNVIKIYLKNHDYKSNLLISNVFRWQVNIPDPPRHVFDPPNCFTWPTTLFPKFFVLTIFPLQNLLLITPKVCEQKTYWKSPIEIPPRQSHLPKKHNWKFQNFKIFSNSFLITPDPLRHVFDPPNCFTWPRTWGFYTVCKI